MKNLSLVFIITCLLFFHSCDDNSTGPETDKVIIDFIESQMLPKPQHYKISFFNSQENVSVFKLNFGEPFDCPSGCAYSVGMGLKYKNKIGWLYLNGLSETDLIQKDFYDIDSTEMYLFSESFWNELDKADQWNYRYALLPILVKDVNTPLNVLNRIAQGLYSFIDSYLGELLLLNIKVINDRTILTLLANLPVFQGDAYSSVREKAQQLLNGLG
jgi:hypothetical protein